ncbi:hypothetical protein BDF20DRAFT_100402 [Mycotypha africana]|uniref:uncharacterized protein n=1 Tax=Mycotypha africana TaxID=64632 RepID=UPI0023012B86|nr:uncharacterized protein BDF20DRAFT_100402 [Mycotypha africana]KAI8970041.1 hypothetical protein BDF20DRAFT_100402 [Mycotypha africana]
MVFEGITYNPPQKVYLSAMFTPDMRCYLLNQAQQIKNRKTLWHTQYRRMTNGARAFIFHLPNYHPRSSNECWRWSRWVAADLADWAQEFINIPYKFNFPTQDSFICRLLQKEAEESPDDCLKLPRNITKKIHLEELRAFKRRMLREKEERERRVEEQERLRKKTELEQKKRAQQVLEEERKRIDAEIQRKKREEAKEKQQMLNRMEQAERQRKQAEVLRQSKKGEQHSQKIMAHKQDEAKQKQQQCLVRELQIRTPPGTQSASSTNSRSSPTPPVSTSSNFNIASHLTAAANPECRRTLSPSRSSNGGSSKKFITSLKKPTMENHQQADVSNKQPIELSKNVSNASIVTPAIAAEARSGFNASPSSSLDISQQQVISASAISTVNSSSSSDTDRPSTHTSKEQQAAAVKPIQNVTSHSQSAKGTFSKDMNDVSTVYTEYNTIFKRKASPTDSPKTKILKTSMSSSKNSNVLTTESPEHQQQQISFNQIVSEAFDTSFLHTELSNILEDLETL